MNRISRVGMLAASLLALSLVPLSVSAQEESVPPEALPITDAVKLHISQEGLKAIGDGIEGVLPTGMLATGLAGEFNCDESTPETLVYSADDIQVHLATDEVTITPTANRLDIHLGMTLWSDDADITLAGDCVLILDESCTLGLPPTALNVDLAMDLLLVDGEIEAQVSEMEFSHGNFGNPIETGCLLGDAIETMQGYGVDLLGSILDQVLEEQLGSLETTVEEALSGLTGSLALEDSLEILGTVLNYQLAATELSLSSTGLKLGFEALFTTPAFGSCIPEDSGAYVPSSHDMPAMTGLIPGTATPYHAAVLANEDLLNQALYVAWQGGLLCLRLSDLVDFELTTGYLALIDEELINSVWPEPIALDVVISPVAPPTVDFGAGPAAGAEMLLDVYGPEFDRATRLWGNRIYAELGLGVQLTPEGVLNIDIDFDMEQDLGITVDYNEFLPSDIPYGFTALVPDLVSSFVDIDSLAPSFPLPAPFGIGLGDLETIVLGDQEDYLGVYVLIDSSEAEPLEIGPIDLAGVGCDGLAEGGELEIPGCDSLESGCEEEMGCGGEGGCGGEEGCGGDEGCGGEAGCSVSSQGLRINALTILCWGVPFLIASRRRR
jgi:hypothetical protein